MQLIRCSLCCLCCNHHCPIELCNALPSTVGGEICAVFDTEPSADYAYDESLTQLIGGGDDDDDDDDMVLL